MRILGLTLAGALAVWSGTGVALAASHAPAAEVATQPAATFNTSTLFVTWGPDVDPSLRELALVLSGATVVAESSDGSVTQVDGVDLTATRGALEGFGAAVVASVQSADEFLLSKFGLSGYQIVSLDATPARAGQVQIPLVLEGREELMVLDRHSVRSSDFRVLVDRGSGTLEEVPAPPVTTYEGSLDGVEGSVIAASMHNGLSAIIRIDGPFGRDFVVQPVSEAFDGAPADAHIVYTSTQVIAEHAECGGAMLHGGMGGAIKDAEDTIKSSGSSRVRKMCQIAFDADFEFYQLNGSSIPNTTADIENVLNSVRITYERDCDVTFEITTIIVRSNSSDPYTSSNSETLLNQFRSHWQSSQTGITRDIAHLMTGRNVDGSTIGIAWLSAVCTSNGYGLSQSRFSSNFNQRFSLTAHEVGHNFSAGHCDGNGDCHIMCSGINGCNGLGNPPFFGTSERNGIHNYAQNRPCLTTVGNTPPVLSVISPTNGASFSQGQTVQFIGAATDDIDDSSELSDDITWTSNLQGLLGTGPGVVRNDLVVGTHTITASVTDSGGLSDTELRTINITGSVTIPAAPSGQATVESTIGNALHTWIDNSTDETSFTVQRQQKSGVSWIGTSTFTGIAANATSFNNTPGEGVWRYRVRANNGAGSSAYTAWANAMPLGPTAPAASQDAGVVTFSWSDNSLFEENFDVQRQERVGTTWTNSTIFVQVANTTSYVESPGSGQWRYRVRSKVPSKFSAYTAWTNVTVP